MAIEVKGDIRANIQDLEGYLSRVSRWAGGDFRQKTRCN